MSNKYETGSYLVLTFDKHGTYISKTREVNYTTALLKGETLIQKPPAASFVVTRTVYNSIDNSYPWGGYNEGEEG